MATNYARGYAFERRTNAALKKEGALFTMRAGGSKGVADLVAFFNPLIYPDEHVYRTCPGVWLVQCKRHGVLPPAEEVALIATAELVGAVPVLARIPEGGKGVEFVNLTERI